MNENFILNDDNYNVNLGGHKPPRMVGKDNPFFGKTHDKETRKKMSEKRKAVKLSKEHKDKINKNPEKIRKTAEKHRGMKRTEETCKRISDAKKGCPSAIKGKMVIHDVKTGQVKFIPKDEIIPEGYLLGSGRFGKRCKK